MPKTIGKEILTAEQLRDWASSKEHDIAQPLVEASENAMDMLKNLGVAARTIQESTVIACLDQTIDFALKFAPQALAASTTVLKMMEAPGQVRAGEIRRIATSSMANQADDLPASVLKGLIPGTRDFGRWGIRKAARDTRLLNAEQIHSGEILPALQIFDELAYQAEQAITANKDAGDAIEENLRGMPGIRMDAQNTATEHDEEAQKAEEAFVLASEQSLRLAISKIGILQDDSGLDTLLKQLVESRIRARDHRIKATEAVARRDRPPWELLPAPWTTRQ